MSQEELDAMLRSMAGNGDADSSKGESDMAGAGEPTPAAGMDEECTAKIVEDNKKPLVQRVEFAQLKPRPKSGTRQTPEESLYNNIPLVLSGELGTVEITVRELLALEEGSVVKLDKTAGESATVLVNEQFLGQAETVVVNDRFGLRITTIGKDVPKDRKEEAEKEKAGSKTPPADDRMEEQAQE